VVIQRVSGDGDAYERRASAYRNLKKFKEAIADYTKAIAIDPKDPEGYRRRAHAHMLAGDNKSAVADFRALLKIKPDDAEALGELKALETRANTPVPTPTGATPAAPGPLAKPGSSPAMAPPAASPH
jgi:tetratricopeptide (TPR) repeat protein